MPSKPGIRLFLLAAAAAFQASPALGAGPAPLPLSRVRLYETGVGYFERTGSLGARGVALPVPAGHLDDALKTLVVLSEDPKTRIGGVEFASSLSPGRARSLAGLPGAEDGTPLGLTTLLRGLRGTNVEVTAQGVRVVGRLVEVVDAAASDLESCVREAPAVPDKPLPCTPKKHATLIVLGAAGDIRRVSIDEVTSVRPTEPEVARRIGAALDTVSDRNAQVMKELHLLAQGKKNVTLGYVAETPVWRASYRLVFGAEKTAQIQGWALLHNDTDEAWRSVRVEIVNGRPDSFLFPLAAPRYGRRELVTPTRELSTLPQLASATTDQMWGDEIGEAYGAGGLGLTGYGEGGGGSGEGIGLGRIGTVGHGGGGGDDPSGLLSVGNLAGIAPATGVESGALFRFTLAEPIDLRAHGSVLAPFLAETIESSRIALFRSSTASARSAVLLTNRGKQTLPSGTLAVFSDGGFAGESILPRMKPDETQVVEFGSDLDVELVEKAHVTKDETRLLSFESGTLVEHFVRYHSLRYEIENKSGSDRQVLLELDLVNNAKVEEADSLGYDVETQHVLAGFSVPKQSVQSRKLSASEGLAVRHDVKWLAARTLERLFGQGIPAKQRSIVRDALSLTRERDAFRRNRDGWKAVLGERNAEVERLRANARAVGPSASEDIVKRLLEIEDETKKIRRYVATFAAKASEGDRRVFAVLARL